MHLYLITRGIKDAVDRFITQLQGKYLPFKFRAPGTDKLVDSYVQVGVRPVQFWEIVFPEEHKDVVLHSIFQDPQNPLEKGTAGATQHKKHNKFVWALRKALGAEPIPDYKTGQFFPIYKNDIEMIGVGIKKDYWTTLSGAHVKEKEPGAFEGL